MAVKTKSMVEYTSIEDLNDITLIGYSNNEGAKINGSNIKNLIDDSKSNTMIHGDYSFLLENLKEYQMGVCGNAVFVKIGGNLIQVVAGSISKTKKADYLYEAIFTAYERPKEYKANVNPGACSSFRMSHYMGRSLDWYYNNQVDFVIKCQMPGCHKSIGIATLPFLTKDIAETDIYDPRYAELPWNTLDGINECGVYANNNVVPDDISGGLTDSIPTVSKEVSIDAMQIVRYILDNYSSVSEAVKDIKEHVEIRYNRDFAKQNFGIHTMIADKSDCVVLEVINGEVHTKSINRMTNFWVNPVQLNSDGTVYSNINVPEHLPTEENNITPHGDGLERWNTITTFNGSPRELLNTILYTHAYTNTTNPWYSEFVGKVNIGGNIIDITVDTPADDEHLAAIMNYAKSEYESRDRDNPVTWHSTHSCVYDLYTQNISIVSQEDTEHEYNFNLSGLVEIGNIKYRTIKIGNQEWLAENLQLNTSGSGITVATFFYDNNESKYGREGLDYGRLYTWDAANALNLPTGWHLPTKEEWEKMLNNIGGIDIAGKLLKSASGWNSYEGIDALGFAALPSGRLFSGAFQPLSNMWSDFWTATQINDYDAYYVRLSKTDNAIIEPSRKDITAISVRLVKDL